MSNNTYCTYILKCSDGTLYTGMTNDMEKRLKMHNLGKASHYTAARLPVTLVYKEQQEDKSGALKREYQIKQMSRQEKLLLAGLS